MSVDWTAVAVCSPFVCAALLAAAAGLASHNRPLGWSGRGELHPADRSMPRDLIDTEVAAHPPDETQAAGGELRSKAG